MSDYKTLGIKIQLMTDFAAASREVVSGLASINAGLGDLEKKAKTVSAPGIDRLQKDIDALSGRLGAAKRQTQDLADSARRLSGDTDAAAKKTRDLADAAASVASQATAAQRAVLRLQTSLTGIDVIAVNRAGSAMEAFQRETMTASDVVLGLGQAIERLSGRDHTIRMRVVYDAPNLDRVLPPGTVVRAALPSAYGSQYGPIPSRPAPSAYPVLPSEQRYALPPPPGYDRSGYGPIEQPSWRSSATAALPSEPLYALPGGVDPEFNYRRWRAEQAANGTTSGGGPTIPVPPGGFGTGGGDGWNWRSIATFGAGAYRSGGAMQWAGLGNLYAGSMLLAPAVAGTYASADIEDLQYRNREAITFAGGTESEADQMNRAARRTAVKYGSNYGETIGALYDFVSARPENLGWNKGSAQATSSAFETTAMLGVAGGAPGRPLNMRETALDINNVIANLGLSTNNNAEYVKSVRTASNILANLKNKTATEVDLAASSFRAIGPAAQELGLSQAEIVGFVAAMASGKVRGSPAGQGLKRLLLRQAAPSKQLDDLQQYIYDTSGGQQSISLFDKKGGVRSLAAVATDLIHYEDKNKLPSEQKAHIEEELSGLYAFPQLGLFLKSVREQEKKQGGFKAFGESFITGGTGVDKTTGKRLDATENAYKQRTEGNTKTDIDKTTNAILEERQKLFEDMKPTILEVLRGTRALVEGFDRLPAPIKSGIVVTTALVGGFSLLGGASQLVLGALLRLTGGFASTVGGLVQMGSVARTGAAVASLSPILNGVALAVRAVGLALFANPIGLIIGGIALAATALYFAYKNNFLGFRDIVDRVVRDVSHWLGDLGTNVKNGLQNFGHFMDGIQQKVYAGEKWLGDEITALPGKLIASAGDWLHAGSTLIGNFIDGIKKGNGLLVDAVKGAAQKARDILPGSEPKDGSSPLTNLARAGTAMMTNVADGVPAGADQLRQVAVVSAEEIRQHLDDVIHHHKAHKAKKPHAPPMDVSIILRPGETVAQIEADAQRIERALHAAGARIKSGWIDLWGRDGSITRVHGDPVAYRRATQLDRTSTNDPILHQVRDYEERLKRFPQSFEQQMSHLSHALLSTTNQHTQAVIDGLIGTLIAKHKKALDKYAQETARWAGGNDGKHGILGEANTGIGHFNTESQSFAREQEAADERLKRFIETQKGSIPTLQELEKYRHNEQAELAALQRIYQNQITTRDRLLDQLDQLVVRANKIQVTDEKTKEIKSQLLDQAKNLATSIGVLNTQLDNEGQVIVAVGNKVATYTTQIEKAANKTYQWGQILAGAFDKAAKDSLDRLGTSLETGLDSVFNRVFKAKKSGFQGIVGSFFADVFSNITGTIVKTIAGDLQTSATNSIGSFFSRWSHGSSHSSGGGSDVAKVQITDQSGNEIGTSISDDLSATAANTDKAASVIDAVVSMGTGGKKKGKNTTDGTDLSSSGNPISDALTSLEGTKFGKTLGKELGYAAIGSMVASLDNGSQLWASVGSMIGGSFYGPIGAAVGGLIGSLFGPHWGPESNYPDRGPNQAAYGQFLANWQGSKAGGNGKTYIPDLANNVAAGGKTTWQQFEDWANSVGPNLGLLNQAQRDLYTQIEGLMQGNANANLGVTSEHNGVLTLGNGQTISVQDAQTLLATYNQIAASPNSISQAQNANALASSFTSMILNGPAAFKMPLVTAGSLGGPGGSGSAGSGSRSMLPGDRSTRGLLDGANVQIAPPVVNVLQGAQINGDPTTIIQTIQSVLPAITNAMRYSDWQESSRYGNYVSAL